MVVLHLFAKPLLSKKDGLMSPNEPPFKVAFANNGLVLSFLKVMELKESTEEDANVRAGWKKSLGCPFESVMSEMFSMVNLLKSTWPDCTSLIIRPS